MNNLTAIVDGDIILYRICFTVDPEAELYVVKSHCDKYIESLFQRVGNTHYIGIIGIHGSNNPKYIVAPDYKRGRPTDKPPHWNTVMNYLMSKYGFVAISGCETDDAVALCASEIENSIVVSSDKDLLQIEGEHFVMGVMRKGKIVREDKRITVTYEDSIRNYYTQMLTGDVVDNVTAIYGIGPKKAEKLLKDCKIQPEMAVVVLDQYRKAFGPNWEEKYMMNAVLLQVNPKYADNAGFVVPEPIEYKIDIEEPGY